jgi:hypothetical protein
MKKQQYEEQIAQGCIARLKGAKEMCCASTAQHEIKWNSNQMKVIK